MCHQHENFKSTLMKYVMLCMNKCFYTKTKIGQLQQLDQFSRLLRKLHQLQELIISALYESWGEDGRACAM